MPVLTIERPLREKLGEEAVDSLINLINKAIFEQKNDVLKFVEEKFERRLSEEIAGLEVRLTEKISQNYNDLSEKISGTRADMIKWMFIFWVGQVGVILGILFAFFK